MVIPLEIRLTEHEFTINASAVPFGLSMADALELGFLVEVDGIMLVLTPDEYACHSADCRPPSSGGTGGSSGLAASIQAFKKEVGKVDSPDCADGQCEIITDRFVKYMGSRGETAQRVTFEYPTARFERDGEWPWNKEDGRYDDSPTHTVAVVHDTVVDWTAKQFWPSTPFPLVEKLETYKKRWGSVSAITAACHSAACRPPGSGGSGGSLPGSTMGGHKGTLGGGSHHIGKDQQADDMRQLLNDKTAAGKDIPQFKNNHVNKDGTLGIPFTKPGGGGTIEFDAPMQKWVNAKLKLLGVTHEQLVNNLVKDGLGAIDSPQAKVAVHWYSTEHNWGAGLAKTYGVDIDRIFGAVSLTSAMRKWGKEGTGTNLSSSNKGFVETILKKLKEDKPFHITKEMADKFNNYKSEKRGLGEGAHIEPGTYRPSQLSSSSIARLATGLGWKILNTAGTKPVTKAIALIRGELEVNDIVRGTKQRSFVSNLSHPHIDYTSTNDLWHFRAIAGNTKFNFSDRRRNEDNSKVVEGKGNKIRTTLYDYEHHITGHNKKTGKPILGNAPHDIFTGAPPNGGLYTEVTKVTREALDRLKSTDVRFKGMKIHEFQALVWKYAGGNHSALYQNVGGGDG